MGRFFLREAKRTFWDKHRMRLIFSSHFYYIMNFEKSQIFSRAALSKWNFFEKFFENFSTLFYYTTNFSKNQILRADKEEGGLSLLSLFYLF